MDHIEEGRKNPYLKCWKELSLFQSFTMLIAEIILSISLSLMPESKMKHYFSKSIINYFESKNQHNED